MPGKSISEILYQWGDTTVKLLEESLEQKGNVATRNLRQSIKYNVKILGNEFMFILSMADYWRWVDGGRKETVSGGGGVVKPKIYEWIRRKRGLQEVVGRMANEYRSAHPGTKKNTTGLRIQATKSLSYLIARKIHSKGYEGKKFYSSVMTPEYLGDFKNELRKALKRDVEIEIIEVLKEINK